MIIAAEMPDLLWVVFSVFGLEHVAIKPGFTARNALDLYDFPISHSLLMDAVWGALLALGYFLVRRRGIGAWIIFSAVLSHWVLNFVAHGPDMPLAPGEHLYFGLGLNNSGAGILVVEGGLWIVALIVCARATRPETRWGTYGFRSMIVLLTLLWWSGSVVPPPPSVGAVEVANVIIFSCLLPWAYWIDRLRPLKKPLIKIEPR